MLVKRAMFLLLAALGTTGVAVAQDKKPPRPDDEVIRVDTELIEVPIVVTDRAGKPLLNLKKANFSIAEDGKAQEIAEFGATSAPFEVALLLDTSGSTRSELQLLQRSALHFIESLRPGDRVSIVSFNTQVRDKRSVAVSEIVVGLTANRSELRAALEKVNTSNGTPYYDGLLDIAKRIFQDEPRPEVRGRRALVALTDGVDSTSVSDYAEVKELLEEAGIICYFIKVDTRDFFEENLLGDCELALRFSAAQIRRYYRRLGASSRVETTSDFCQLGDFERLAISKKLYEMASDEMNALARISGGKVFPVGDLSEARNAFKSVADEIGTKYSLAYYSTNEKRDGTYRRITVSLKGLPPGTQIRAREGYTAPSN
ncbi:MAG TPA: VWA domain-containing protein [Pyrinomonadaceae bacterium]|nr:VWA domain-containing protein [Pyrinomonadaceae bacterium]